MMNILKKICPLFFIFLAACGEAGGVGTSAGNPTQFPTGLAVASPFDTTEAAPQSSIPAPSLVIAQTTGFVSRYSAAADRIEKILNGSTASVCRFDPELFLTQDMDAKCYGPTVKYEGHPDASGGDPRINGDLPIGDVGFWTETDSETDQACAAAQLNSRLESTHDRSLGALMGLASLICTSNVNSIDLPINGTEDLTTELNALGVADATFNSASITNSDSSGSDQWSYILDFNYSPGSNNYRIIAELTHLPGESDEVYQGKLTTRVNEIMDPPGNCPSTEQTYNGSLLYNRSSASALNVEVRGGNFCGHDSDGTTGGLVDPSKKHNGGTNPTGWANNFSIFTADFNPDSLVGDYSYSWQAGDGDDYTRVLNAVVTENVTTSDLEGEAFYGFGDDVEVSDGSVAGFFCNWAGPSGRGTFQPLAQNQTMSQDSSTGKFDVVKSNITYAPTNSCNYDGSGSFTYDSDGDGMIDTNTSTAITNELVQLLDSNSDGIFDVLEDSGFILPLSPSNL